MDERTYKMLQEARAAGYELVEATKWILTKQRLTALEAEVGALRARLQDERTMLYNLRTELLEELVRLQAQLDAAQEAQS